MAKHIYLNDKERVELEQLIRSGINSARVIGRARTLLLLDRSQGKKRTFQEITGAARVSPWTLRLLADELVALEVVESISHVTVREVLKKANLGLGK